MSRSDPKPSYKTQESGRSTSKFTRLARHYAHAPVEWVWHPFRVIKRQFGFQKVKYKGLAKNTANLVTLFALSNLWMARRSLMRAQEA